MQESAIISDSVGIINEFELNNDINNEFPIKHYSIFHYFMSDKIRMSRRRPSILKLFNDMKDVCNSECLNNSIELLTDLTNNYYGDKTDFDKLVENEINKTTEDAMKDLTQDSFRKKIVDILKVLNTRILDMDSRIRLTTFRTSYIQVKKECNKIMDEFIYWHDGEIGFIKFFELCRGFLDNYMTTQAPDEYIGWYIEKFSELTLLDSPPDISIRREFIISELIIANYLTGNKSYIVPILLNTDILEDDPSYKFMPMNNYIYLYIRRPIEKEPDYKQPDEEMSDNDIDYYVTIFDLDPNSVYHEFFPKLQFQKIGDNIISKISDDFYRVDDYICPATAKFTRKKLITFISSYIDTKYDDPNLNTHSNINNPNFYRGLIDVLYADTDKNVYNYTVVFDIKKNTKLANNQNVAIKSVIFNKKERHLIKYESIKGYSNWSDFEPTEGKDLKLPCFFILRSPETSYFLNGLLYSVLFDSIIHNSIDTKLGKFGEIDTIMLERYNNFMYHISLLDNMPKHLSAILKKMRKDDRYPINECDSFFIKKIEDTKKPREIVPIIATNCNEIRDHLLKLNTVYHNALTDDIIIEIFKKNFRFAKAFIDAGNQNSNLFQGEPSPIKSKIFTALYTAAYNNLLVKIFAYLQSKKNKETQQVSLEIFSDPFVILVRNLFNYMYNIFKHVKHLLLAIGIVIYDYKKPITYDNNQYNGGINLINLSYVYPENLNISIRIAKLLTDYKQYGYVKGNDFFDYTKDNNPTLRMLFAIYFFDPKIQMYGGDTYLQFDGTYQVNPRNISYRFATDNSNKINQLTTGKNANYRDTEYVEKKYINFLMFIDNLHIPANINKLFTDSQIVDDIIDTFSSESLFVQSFNTSINMYAIGSNNSKHVHSIRCFFSNSYKKSDDIVINLQNYDQIPLVYVLTIMIYIGKSVLLFRYKDTILKILKKIKNEKIRNHVFCLRLYFNDMELEKQHFLLTDKCFFYHYIALQNNVLVLIDRLFNNITNRASNFIVKKDNGDFTIVVKTSYKKADKIKIGDDIPDAICEYEINDSKVKYIKFDTKFPLGRYLSKYNCMSSDSSIFHFYDQNGTKIAHFSYNNGFFFYDDDRLMYIENTFTKILDRTNITYFTHVHESDIIISTDIDLTFVITDRNNSVIIKNKKYDIIRKSVINLWASEMENIFIIHNSEAFYILILNLNYENLINLLNKQIRLSIFSSYEYDILNDDYYVDTIYSIANSYKYQIIPIHQLGYYPLFKDIVQSNLYFMYCNLYGNYICLERILSVIYNINKNVIVASPIKDLYNILMKHLNLPLFFEKEYTFEKSDYIDKNIDNLIQTINLIIGTENMTIKEIQTYLQTLNRERKVNNYGNIDDFYIIANKNDRLTVVGGPPSLVETISYDSGKYCDNNGKPILDPNYVTRCIKYPKFEKELRDRMKDFGNIFYNSSLDIEKLSLDIDIESKELFQFEILNVYFNDVCRKYSLSLPYETRLTEYLCYYNLIQSIINNKIDGITNLRDVVTNNPTFSKFHTAFGQFIRYDQQKLFEAIISEQNNANVYQLLMGRGKSKVIVPLLIYEKIKSHNIFVVVPIHLVKQTTETIIFSHNMMLSNIEIHSIEKLEKEIEFNNVKFDFSSNKRHIFIISDTAIKVLKLNLYSVHPKKDDYMGYKIYENRIKFVQNSYFIFDEIDTMINPLTSDLNIVSKYNDFENKELFTEILVSYMINNKVLQDISFPGISEELSNKYSRKFEKISNGELKENYQYGFDPLFIKAMPYLGSENPVIGSQFSDIYLVFFLTIKLFNHYGVTMRMLETVFNDYFRSNDKDIDFIEFKFMDTIVGSINSWNINELTRIQTSVNGNLELKRLFLIAYIKKYVLKHINIAISQINISFIDILSNDFSPNKAMFSGTINMLLPNGNYNINSIKPDDITNGALVNAFFGTMTQIPNIIKITEDNNLESFCKQLSGYNVLIDVSAYLRIFKLQDILKQLCKGTQKRYCIFMEKNIENIITNTECNDIYVYDNENENMNTNILCFNTNTTVDINTHFIWFKFPYTRGTDMLLPPNTRGIITYDSTTVFSEFLQGMFRLRKLNQTHTIDFISTDKSIIHTSLDEVFKQLWIKEQEQLHTTYKHKFYYQNIKSNQRFINIANKNFTAFSDEDIPIDDINDITFSTILQQQYNTDNNNQLFLEFKHLDDFIKLHRDQKYVNIATQIQQEIQVEKDISINTNREVIQNNQLSQIKFDQGNTIVNLKTLLFNSIPVIKVFDVCLPIKDYLNNKYPDTSVEKQLNDFQNKLEHIYVSPEFVAFYSNNFPNFKWFKYSSEKNNYFPGFDMSELFNFYCIKYKKENDLIYIIITPFEYERIIEIKNYNSESLIGIPNIVIYDKLLNDIYFKDITNKYENVNDFFVTMIMGTELTLGICIKAIRNHLTNNENNVITGNKYVDVFKYVISVLSKMYHVNNFNTSLQICLQNIVKSHQKSNNISEFYSYMQQQLKIKQSIRTIN